MSKLSDNFKLEKGLKVILLHGIDSQCFSHDAMVRSEEWYKKHSYNEGDVKTVYTPNYGHLDPWLGKNAAKDIYEPLGLLLLGK